MGLGKERDQLGLGPVRVLELVDQDVAVALLQLEPGRRRVAQQPQREADLVAEVDQAGLAEQRLVAGIGPGQLELAARHPAAASAASLGPPRRRRTGRAGWAPAVGLTDQPVGVGEVGGRADVLVLAPAEQRGQRGQEAGRVAQRPVGVQLELEQALAQEDHDLRPRQDPHVGRQAQLERELADQPIPEGMERGDGGVRVAIRDQLVHPELHLGRGLVREREGEDLRGPGGPTRSARRSGG